MTLVDNPGRDALIQNRRFRRYVATNAQNLGVTGVIFRTQYMNIRLTAEGTIARECIIPDTLVFLFPLR